MSYCVPISKPSPNIDVFISAMDGKVIPDRPPLVEYLVDNAVMEPILENLMGRKWVETKPSDEFTGGQLEFSRESAQTINAWLDNLIAFWYHMGYDFVRVEHSLALPAHSEVIPDTAKAKKGGSRAWQNEHSGPIQTWSDFESYPWPKVQDSDFYVHQYLNKNLPDGMGLITCHAGGIFEHTVRLLGYESLCYKLVDDIELVEAVIEKVGNLILEYNKVLSQIDCIKAILQGDDFGFKTQTLLPPNIMKKHFLPWHKKYAQVMHEKNIRYYLHSCGEVSSLMDYLIEEVKIDGKHSFEDMILPITEAKKKYGDKIALLGGIDIHKLTTYSPDLLRKHIRKIIDQFDGHGRFAIGSGNSITSYVPVENYLTMLDEALK